MRASVGYLTRNIVIKSDIENDEDSCRITGTYFKNDL